MQKIIDKELLREFSSDAGIISLEPSEAAIARSEEEVMQAIKDAGTKGISVTARGAGTSIPSQSVGKGLILLQERTRVDVGPTGKAVCEPGVLKADLNGALAGKGLWMPVDPSSYMSCTVGGMVANNSSGVRTPKYGSTIDYVDSLRVALPGERVRQIGPVPTESALGGDAGTRKVAELILDNQMEIEKERPPVTKNSSGYRLERIVHDGVFDLPKLFVGSEGTLGVTTQVTFTTKPLPKWKLLFVCESSKDGLDRLVEAFRKHSPSALELVDKSVFKKTDRMSRLAKVSRTEEPYLFFCELDGTEGTGEAVLEEIEGSEAGAYDPMVLSSRTEITAAWEVRNETLVLAQEMKQGLKKLVPGVEDLTAPPGKLRDLIELLVSQFGRIGSDYILYGHAGDANLHARPFIDVSGPAGRRMLDDLMEECFEAIWKMRGSITGEHGDGMLRAKYVPRQYPKTYWIMKEIKETLDTKGMLNPGVKIV